MSLAPRPPLADASIECVAVDCGAAPVHEAPVPLCPTHLRWVYEFAQGVVVSYWRESLTVAANAAPEPEPEIVLPKPPTSDVDSWVYFVRIGELIKIGYSTYPQARFRTLKVDDVLAVIPGTMADEKRCHAAFRHLREHGEYFRPGPDLMEFIRHVAAESSSAAGRAKRIA